METKIENILTFKQKKLEQIGNRLVSEIISDAQEKGLMQDGRQKLRYRSKQYVKYKANAMRRLTKTKQGKRTSGKIVAQTIKGKHNITKGTSKLKAYSNRSVNTETSFVNLTLTGDMFKSLKLKEANNQRIVLAYGQSEGAKVIRLKEMGYNVTTLNNKNRLLVKALLLEDIKDNIKKDLVKKIQIVIG